ncbi:MAG TPA: hypothetical protein VK142_08490 [Bacillota bacterium]|nr:hypothetical protein [Bacillota bacterium]
MRYVNKIIIVCLILIVSVVSVKAESDVPIYDQTAVNKYKSFQESIGQNLSDIENESYLARREGLTDIEAAIAHKSGTSREHVQQIIADYKQKYVNAIMLEVDQLKSDMLDKYEAEKSDLIEQQMTDDVAIFLDDILSE